MTVKELYELMVSAGKENYKILIQYRDDGGKYIGKDEEIYLEVSDQKQTFTL